MLHQTQGTQFWVVAIVSQPVVHQLRNPNVPLAQELFFEAVAWPLGRTTMETRNELAVCNLELQRTGLLVGQERCRNDGSNQLRVHSGTIGPERANHGNIVTIHHRVLASPVQPPADRQANCNCRRDHANRRSDLWIATKRERQGKALADQKWKSLFEFKSDPRPMGWRCKTVEVQNGGSATGQSRSALGLAIPLVWQQKAT